MTAAAKAWKVLMEHVGKCPECGRAAGCEIGRRLEDEWERECEKLLAAQNAQKRLI